MRLGVADMLADQSRPVRLDVADGDVGLAAVQVAQVVGGNDRDGELGGGGADACHDGGRT